LLQLAGSFLENDIQSYRRTVRPVHAVIGYQTLPGASAIDERALHHMTVWRVLTWLGCQMAALQMGVRLLGEYDPTSTCHRFVGAVAPHKFRSPPRQRELSTARRLLHLIDHWNCAFREKFFPRFATRGGFS
jgi:hypothetical protein